MEKDVPQECWTEQSRGAGTAVEILAVEFLTTCSAVKGS